MSSFHLSTWLYMQYIFENVERLSHSNFESSHVENGGRLQYMCSDTKGK